MDDDEPPGVPEWVVTYGDMMSLLLTFFIMLVSLSELQADKKFRAVLDSIQKQLGYRTAPLSPPGVNFPLNAMIQQFDTLGSFSNKHKHRRGLRQESIVGDEIRVFRTRDGDAVLVGLRIPFTPGEAELSELARARLTVIVGKLAGRKNKVEIRAHTSPESHPNSTTSLEKTDLSYARARAVLEFMVKNNVNNIDEKRLRITAAADIEPLTDTGDAESRMLDRVEVYNLDSLISDYDGRGGILDGKETTQAEEAPVGAATPED